MSKPNLEVEVEYIIKKKGKIKEAGIINHNGKKVKYGRNKSKKNNKNSK